MSLSSLINKQEDSGVYSHFNCNLLDVHAPEYIFRNNEHTERYM
jgi:hypothetical protein